MKYLLATLSLILFLTASLHAQEKEYAGTLDKHVVSATLNWLDEESVVGVINLTEKEQVFTFNLTGQNSATGVIKASLANGTTIMGKVILKKTTTAEHIIWSGNVTAPDGSDQGVLKLYRAR